MGTIISLPDQGMYRTELQEEALSRAGVSENSHVALDINDLEAILDKTGKPDLFIVDLGWATDGLATQSLYDVLGSDDARDVPVVVIGLPVSRETVPHIEQFHNVIGYLPSGLQNTSAMAQVITEFLETQAATAAEKTVTRADFDQRLQAVIESANDSDGDFYMAASIRNREKNIRAAADFDMNG